MPSIGEIALLANTGSGSGDADAAAEWLRRSDAELGVEEGTELNVDGELVESGPVELRVEPAAFEPVVG